jgi:hypothetical protein
MIELRVPETCRVAGRPLSKVGFPSGAIVGALLRGGDVIIPTGEEVLRPGDDAVVEADLAPPRPVGVLPGGLGVVAPGVVGDPDTTERELDLREEPSVGIDAFPFTPAR